MLAFIKSSSLFDATTATAAVTGDGDPLLNSLFSSVHRDYGRVVEQIEDLVSDDCLQYVVESMWRFDQ
ncbi:hypothetical protein HK100_002540, partial [Physocladia obscura]